LGSIGVPFERTRLEEESFQTLKDEIKAAVERYGFYYSKKATLESDASGSAGGGVIKQLGDTEERVKELIVLYDFFLFTPAEQRYGIYK
jgi:hypothetical protein